MATKPVAGVKPVDYNQPFGDYDGYRLVIAASICMGLSTLFVGLRLWTRRYVTQMFGADDYLIGLAWVCAMILSISDIVQCDYGTGTHLWELPLDKFQTFLKLQMVVGNFYTASLPLAKISILAFYLRISQNRTFRLLVYLVMGFIAAYASSAVIVIICSCDPIAASWDLALAALPSTKCVNRPIFYLVQSSFNITSDICIILLPIRTVWNLQMALKQRLSVIAIFACGFFICIVSIIRLRSLVVLLNSTDLTWDTTDVLIWSTIESHVTIICACSPHFKPLIKRFLPGFLSSNHSKSYSKYPTNARRSQALGSQLKSQHDGYEMYGGETEGTMTVIGSRKRGGCESEESILNAGSKDVYITKTVNIS